MRRVSRVEMYFSPVSEGFRGFQRVSEFVSNGGRDRHDPDPARCRPPYARGGVWSGAGRRGGGGLIPPPSHVIIIISVTLQL
jgi:hypothetical protein